MLACGLLPATGSAFTMYGKASRLRQSRLACLGLKINWLIFACSFCFSGGYFPEFVAMVPVSLWGSSLGVEGVFARRCVYARNRS